MSDSGAESLFYELAPILLLVGLSGAFGGFLGGIGSKELKLLRLPGKRKISESQNETYLDLGWIADVLLGAGAALAGLFVAENIKIEIEQAKMGVADGAQLTAYSIILGFAGRRVLNQFAETISRRVDQVEQRVINKSEEVDKKLEARSTAMRADSMAQRGDYEKAAELYREAYKLDEDDPDVLHGLGNSLAWYAYGNEDAEGLREAVGYLDQSIALYDDNVFVYYDRAGTKNAHNDLVGRDSINRYPMEGILNDLAVCVGVVSPEQARTDPDLESLLENEEFNTLFPDAEMPQE